MIITLIYKRNSLKYCGLTMITIFLGLLSRRYSSDLPWWIVRYVGDVLWSIMVFLLIAVTFNKSSTMKIVKMSLIFSYLIELSQLYQGNWINQLRQTTLGGLVLGRGFLVSDLVCYTLGIILVGVTEYFIITKIKKG